MRSRLRLPSLYTIPEHSITKEIFVEIINMMMDESIENRRQKLKEKLSHYEAEKLVNITEVLFYPTFII